ncbi:unnamed protein product, partial [Rangifer tarandus platyrhynchus]
APFLMGSPPTPSQVLDLLLEDREVEVSEAQERTVTNSANHVVLGQPRSFGAAFLAVMPCLPRAHTHLSTRRPHTHIDRALG